MVLIYVPSTAQVALLCDRHYKLSYEYNIVALMTLFTVDYFHTVITEVHLASQLRSHTDLSEI